MGGDELLERLDRIERMLRELMDRVERLEAATGMGLEEVRLALELAALAVPLGEVAARLPRLVRALRLLQGHVEPVDPITRAIIEALAVRGPLTLRGLEREVRRIRGRASRAAIRERLRILEEQGVVRIAETPRGLRISLAGFEEKEAEALEEGGGPSRPSGGSGRGGG